MKSLVWFGLVFFHCFLSCEKVSYCAIGVGTWHEYLNNSGVIYRDLKRKNEQKVGMPNDNFVNNDKSMGIGCLPLKFFVLLHKETRSHRGEKAEVIRHAQVYNKA